MWVTSLLPPLRVSREMQWNSLSGRGREESEFWLGPGGIQGWGLLLRDGGSGPGIHLQLYPGRDAREVTLHILGLHQAAEALDAGNLLGLCLKPHPGQVQVSPVYDSWWDFYQDDNIQYNFSSPDAWLTIPLSTSNVLLSKLFPLSLGPTLDFIICFIGAMGLYMYIFGYIKQFNILRFSYPRIILSSVEIVLASFLR